MGGSLPTSHLAGLAAKPVPNEVVDAFRSPQQEFLTSFSWRCQLSACVGTDLFWNKLLARALAEKWECAAAVDLERLLLSWVMRLALRNYWPFISRLGGRQKQLFRLVLWCPVWGGCGMFESVRLTRRLGQAPIAGT